MRDHGDTITSHPEKKRPRCANGFLMCRDHGGTIASHPEKKRPSLKVAARIGGPNGGSRHVGTGYSVPKLNSSMPVLELSRPKEGSTTLHSELPDNAALEKAKDLFLIERRKPSFSEQQRLPQWGLGKRSRCKPTKQVEAPATDRSVRSHQLPPLAVHANSSPSLKASGPASNGHSSTIRTTKKEAPAERNGEGQIRCARDGQAAVRAGGTERDRAWRLKVDHGLRARHQNLENGACNSNLGNQSSSRHGQSHQHHGSSIVTASSSEGTTLFEFDKSSQLPLPQQKAELDIVEWVQINLALSRKEKEEDFLDIRGCKLPSRPKKRLKVVERTLHYVTPGNLLMDMARGRYDVTEKKCTKKKPGGLRAMESLASDSD